nr:hypothetical protein [uncultured Treponema sp.]
MITVNLRYSGKGNAALDFAKEMTRIQIWFIFESCSDQCEDSNSR